MGVTTPNAIFFHIPKTGGSWVADSLLKAFPNRKDGKPFAERVVYSAGWDSDTNGIHIPPTVFKKKPNKFTFAFVRHPLAWYKSYFQFMNQEEQNWVRNFKFPGVLGSKCASNNFHKFIRNVKKYASGYFSNLVKKFEKVDFMGKQESLYFDLCDALDAAGEEYNPDDFLAQHVNVSIPIEDDYTDKEKEFILESEKYVINKYY